jgi:nucleotide-binding universal stress UspA family protein
VTIKRILVATDGSPDAERAIDWLAEFPLPADAAADVVSAVQAPFAADAALALGWSELIAENERVVAEARRRLEKRWSAVTGRVLDGDPRRTIVEAAASAGWI